MTDSVYMEGWLIRSRDRGMHFPPFKSKWVRRYFVLRVCDKRLGAYVLDEFRKEDKRRLRKSLDLVRCVQIDSHLQLADSSCATTSRFGGFQWIFSLYLTKGTSSNKKHPLYFVSESEEVMTAWSTCEEDELHTFEFVHNPKRVSRFNSRLCTTLPHAEYGVGSRKGRILIRGASAIKASNDMPLHRLLRGKAANNDEPEEQCCNISEVLQKKTAVVLH
ncbi:unnamed protein product [Nippostrongylus brasiliensis]|uniref:Multisubstrate adaptor protein SOC-1 (inferred by orthology to a C. elegans protein) n=1 Tax=Nippostrongylus brasiliensis TaxID=27835 RepID=A0A0N4YW66_NIPBR|nr:unnamed protein product [Nippostrongylus brasiliensis]